MQRSIESFYFINQLRSAEIKNSGGKGYNLFVIRDFCNVPDFYILTTRAFEEWSVNKQIPRALKREFTKIFNDLLKVGHIAVRSSATTEDTAAASFAGMYNTSLYISNIEEGIEAVVKTWQSLDSERACNYRKTMNCDRGAMAVIIQHQLVPEISGVMFTANPLAAGEILIECCPGLGDKLVSGEIEPNQYRIKGKKVIKRTGENILSEDQIQELVKTGLKIERVFRRPQDIEWAYEKGRLYILQSRPITSIAEKIKKGTVWCNVNVRETIPGPISPMMYSIFDSIMFPIIIIDAFGVPISREQYYKYPGVERVLGRLYWNVNNTMALGRTIDPVMRLLSADKNLDPQMAAAFKQVDIKTIPTLIPFFRSVLFSISAMIRLANFIIKSSIFMRGTVRKLHKVLLDTLAMAEEYEVAADLDTGIINVQKLLVDVGTKISRRYFGGLFLSLFYFIFLGVILKLRLGARGEAIARKMIVGLIDKTGEMVIAVEKLAEKAREKAQKLDTGEVKKLYRTDHDFKNIFDDFILEFGHRGPAEFDIASFNWREDYDMVFQLIASHNKSRRKQDRKEIIKGIVNEARPFERFFIKLILPRIEAFTHLRESGKHYYFKATARAKDQFFKISEHLVAEKYYDNIHDIFLLELKDLNAIIDRTVTSVQIRAIVDRRKKERIEYEKIDPPDIIFEDGRTISFTADQASVMNGEPLSYGKVRAKARIIKDFKSSSALRAGEILVTHHTDPGWTPLFSVSGGVIVEAGGLICHAAMVAREFGIPAVVLRNATLAIPDGALIELDADMGTIRIVARNAKERNH